MTRNARPSCSPTSNSAQMCGWLSEEMARASISNRARRSGRSAEFRVQHLDRDEAIQPRIARPVDLTHPADADQRQEFVRAVPGSRGRRHVDLRMAMKTPSNTEGSPKTSALSATYLTRKPANWRAHAASRHESSRWFSPAQPLWPAQPAHTQEPSCLVSTSNGAGPGRSIADPRVRSSGSRSPRRQLPRSGGGRRNLRIRGRRPFAALRLRRRRVRSSTPRPVCRQGAKIASRLNVWTPKPAVVPRAR